MSVAAEEGQVVDDGDINEVVGLLDYPGNGFKVIAAMFGDENIWGALSSEEERWHTICDSWCSGDERVHNQ